MTLDPQQADKAQPAAGTEEHRRQVRKAAVASMIGTTIEWYDYFLYGTAAALVFPKVFFPASSDYAGQLESFAILFVGFVARPIGAAIFGHWGDRIGRKATLIITLLLMGISSTLIGLLPGASSIGVLAPTFLVVLRVVQGVAVGGEWGGSVLLSMEWGDQKRRGLMGSWPQLGVAAGLFLGTLVFTITNQVAGEEAFLAGAWRIPFLISLVLVGIGLFIRLQILETPMFAAVVSENRVAKAPVKDVLRYHWREVVLSALLRMSEQIPFYVVTTFVLAYMVDDAHGYSKNFVLVGTLIASGIDMVLVPTFGHLSDTVGRKKIYMSAAAVMGVWGFIYFGMLDSGVAWLAFLAICLGLVPHAMQYGPQAALIAESYPTSLRYGGSGLGYQLASIIAGGPAPLVATFLLHQFGSGFAISSYILVAVIIALAACAALPDRSRMDISDDATYARART